MNEGRKVEEFIKEFRDRIGDTTCEVPVSHLIASINTALRRLARERGLDKLFRFMDSFELASIKSDGSKSAEWNINKANLGMIIDVESVQFIDASGCGVFDVTPCYVSLQELLQCNPIPEDNAAGLPSKFTINQIGGNSRLMFDVPIDRPLIVRMVYTAFHPRIRTTDEIIRLPYAYEDIIMEAVIIYYQMESADFATARALLEDYDKLVAEARELLARNPTGAAFRRLRGSF